MTTATQAQRKPVVTMPMLKFALTKMHPHSTLELNRNSVEAIVNAHDELVAALRECIERIEMRRDVEPTAQLLARARAVLVKASA